MTRHVIDFTSPATAMTLSLKDSYVIGACRFLRGSTYELYIQDGPSGGASDREFFLLTKNDSIPSSAVFGVALAHDPSTNEQRFLYHRDAA